jgi:large subunit ribosomal protein L10
MNTNLENKKQLVEEIKGKLEKAQSVVFVNYSGLNVAQADKLRKDFRENNAEYKVYKNRLMLRALNELGISGVEEHLSGTTSVAFGYENQVVPAKLLADAAKESNTMAVKFGIFDGKVVDSNYVKQIASLPPKEILIAQLLSALNGPVSGLARALNAIAEKA